MPQLLLFIAIMFELVASTFLKLSDGFKNIFFGLGAYLLYAISFWCFAKSLISINFSVAYAIWCSVGIVVTTLISIFIFMVLVFSTTQTRCRPSRPSAGYSF